MTVCRFFLQGRCVKGNSCSFSHDVGAAPVPPALPDIQGLNLRRDHDDFSREYSGVYAQFEDGGRVSKVNLPSDFSSIRMSGLAADSTPASVSTLIGSFGFEVPARSVRILRLGEIASALVKVEDPLFAKSFCAIVKSRPDAQGPVFEVQSIPSSTTSRAAGRRVSCNKVHISWHKPTRAVWMNFGNEDIAKRASERFNSGLYKILGQKVSADPPNHSPSRGRNPVAWTLTLKGVPSYATKSNIEDSIFLRQDRPRHYELGKCGEFFSTETTAVFVESLFANIGPNEFHWDPSQSHGKRFKVVARFEEEADARESVRTLHDQSQGFLNTGKLTVQLVNSAKFKISTMIYDALEEQLAIHAKEWRQAHLQYKVYRNTDPLQLFTTLKVEGESTKDVSNATNLLERTIGGETIEDAGMPVWSAALSSNGTTYRLIKQIQDEHGILLIRNKAKKHLKFFGPHEKYPIVLEAVLRAIKSDPIATHAIELDPADFLWACSGGLRRIISALGDDAVAFDVVSRPKRIIITGTEEQYLSALIMIQRKDAHVEPPDASLANEDCTVCWTEADNPIRTNCSHIYCLECFGDMCVAAGSQDKEFSLNCQGDMGNCGKVFTLLELQNHLSSNTFEEVLEASLKSYISRRPQDFHNCPTPDCGYTYRVTPNANTHTCQNCLEVTCTACHGQHGSMSCAAYKDLKSGGVEAFEQFKRENGIKDCPICKTPIEKTEGCDHMTCGGCKTHICWVCLKTFKDSRACYAHMNEAHGGIGLDHLRDIW
ncbi:uncharacterized protein BDZ99DRAFT_554405 [Mytilinidion resinicola]|uniref:Ariadne RING finger n=1 Tax=Mytilinidion resinicola TaxID=574789 RepID=A0A6A6Z1G3_9PEZI|nr:uncharacterized protein BDZ99DRAFT_554405 [Mytilinidion resinicola]KAF2814124.1 hypothetical protein BDZ99DRAFT_554405 [Mytilinidion resinicola]